MRPGGRLGHRARGCRDAVSASSNVDQARLLELLSHAVPDTVRIGKLE